MEDKTITLRLRAVEFGSNTDELLFWEWIKRIQCVYNVYGKGWDTMLEVHSDRVSEDDLENLYALFKRYRVKKINQLDKLNTQTNKEWEKNRDELCKADKYPHFFGKESDKE